LPTLKKNKKTLKHKPTEKKDSKMTMTRKLNNDNGVQDWRTEHQAVTGGIFYCRVCAGFSVSASNKLSCNLTGKCFEIGNKNIPPIRSLQARKTKMTIMNLVSLQT
jgi:hypothetical protein